MYNYRSFHFCPWALAESHSSLFNIIDVNEVPIYSKNTFYRIREIINSHYPERFPGADLSAYKFAAVLLDTSDFKIADIACGHGSGTHLLAGDSHEVIRVDYSASQIKENQARSTNDHVSFIADDACDSALFSENFLGVIVSMHSMEHFPDDIAFLINCQKWLKEKGKLLLEVLLLMKYPFKDIGKPLGGKHLREYEIDFFTNLCGQYFKIKQTFGINRGLYLNSNRSRNAILLLLEN
jgi:SAM-dependent methyltransferase